MKVIYYLLFFMISVPSVSNIYAQNSAVKVDDCQGFVQSTIEDLQNTLMNSTSSTEVKVKNIKKIFDKYFDAEYIKNRAISMIKRSSKMDKSQEAILKDTVMQYLFHKYVKITSDYKNVDVNIKSIQTSGKVKFANCEVISRGKQMNFKLQISNKNGQYKIQGITFENVDLTSPEGFYRKYNEDCGKNLDKFIGQLSDMTK